MHQFSWFNFWECICCCTYLYIPCQLLFARLASCVGNVPASEARAHPCLRTLTANAIKIFRCSNCPLDSSIHQNLYQICRILNVIVPNLCFTTGKHFSTIAGFFKCTQPAEVPVKNQRLLIPRAHEIQLNAILVLPSSAGTQAEIVAFIQQFVLINEHKILRNPNAQLVRSTVQTETDETFWLFAGQLFHLNECDKPGQHLVDFEHTKLPSTAQNF